jgi:hypothetical protein
MFPARQWGLVSVVTGGADGETTTKGLTGSMYLSKICAETDLFGGESLEGRERLHKNCAGAHVFCGGENDGGS